MRSRHEAERLEVPARAPVELHHIRPGDPECFLAPPENDGYGTADRLASWSQSMTKASKRAVNREPGSPQGTLTCRTPCSGQSTRGRLHRITRRNAPIETAAEYVR